MRLNRQIDNLFSYFFFLSDLNNYFKWKNYSSGDSRFNLRDLKIYHATLKSIAMMIVALFCTQFYLTLQL